MNSIEKVKGPCIILAGAGTGKTYTIVEKIKHLIREKIYPPGRIVCITFSNEAAHNLLSRVQKFVELSEELPIIKTFHAFSADLLRQYGETIGINKEFKILDPDHAKVFLHRYFNTPPYYVRQYISAIGSAKDLGIQLSDFENYLSKQLESLNDEDLDKLIEETQFTLQTLHLKKDNSGKKELSEKLDKFKKILGLKKFIDAWKGYEKLKTRRNYQDYSDLNFKALSLFNANPEISENFDYIVVDEFQDTNKVQLEFLAALSQDKNITVVGDLNQSIYRFRGAYRKNYEDFCEMFSVKKEDIFELAKSYRSTNKILRTAHKIILKNYENKEDCFEVTSAYGKEGDKIKVYELNNSQEEARKVVELVESEISKGTPKNEICVLFRNHHYGRIIKQSLDLKGIPYTSASNGSLLKQLTVRLVIDYLTVLDCLAHEKSGGQQEWWDLVYHLDFSEDDLVVIGNYLKEFKDKKSGENLSEKLFSDLKTLELSDSGKNAAKVLVERLRLLLPFADKEISEILNMTYSVLNFIDEDEKSETNLNLNAFYELAKEQAGLYDSDLGSFIHYISILNNLGIEIPTAEVEKEGVHLMTLHATKGLEYKTVIVTNMASKRFPMVRLTGSLIPAELNSEFKDEEKDNDELEKEHQLYEERRLCYVAFTRAKENLILTYAKEYAGKKFGVSEFLQELEYRDNEDIEFIIDLESKYEALDPVIKSASEFSSISYSKDFAGEISKSLKKEDRVILDAKRNFSEKNVFSPSSLLLFDDCQKKFEYKYVYGMPDEKIVAWESVMMGSFVHKVFDFGVKKGFSNLKEFVDYARELGMESDWEAVDFSEAEHLISVFFARNYGKYSEKSETEKYLSAEIGGLKFRGFADRIDYTSDGLRIIDYKTSKSNLAPKNRNWQLGYYALASSKFGKVKSVVLDMLRLEKPLEFNIDDSGNAVSENGRMKFNIYEVEKELVKTAREIINAYKEGFKACDVEKGCEFCGEYVYGI